MLIVLTWLALMISVVSEFTYGTSVDASQAAGDANVARFRQKRCVIDEAPERNEAVDAAGVFVVPKDAFHA